MNRFMKLYWMFGIIAAALCFINPLIGLFGMVAIIIDFIMVIWDANMRQRLRYYQNPEKLYTIGKNIKGSQQIHDMQVKMLPHSTVMICITGKILAVFSMVMQVIMEAGMTVAMLMNADRGYYNSMSPMNLISEEQYRTAGIPLSILAVILSLCMAISFWQRCNYYKNRIKGE